MTRRPEPRPPASVRARQPQPRLPAHHLGRVVHHFLSGATAPEREPVQRAPSGPRLSVAPPRPPAGLRDRRPRLRPRTAPARRPASADPAARAAPAVRPVPRVATVAISGSAVELAQRLARLAGRWRALGPVDEALGRLGGDVTRPVRLDALVCCLAPDSRVPPELAGRLRLLADRCRARRVVVLATLPPGGPASGRPGGAVAAATAAVAAIRSAMPSRTVAVCARAIDLRRDDERARAVLGAVMVAAPILATQRLR